MSRSRYFPWLDVNRYEPQDVERNANIIKLYMIDRLLMMFKWEGLPDTIPEFVIDKYLFTGGHCIFTKWQDKPVVFFGGWGGHPNEYYLPTDYIVANPYANCNKTFIIDEDCVMISNDSIRRGIMPILDKYAYLLAHSELTMYRHDINSRALALITVDSNNGATVADEFAHNLERGNKTMLVTTSFAPENINAQPLSTAHTNTSSAQMIEYHQYILAQMYQELGINANYNLKRERLSSDEIGLNNDILSPLVDNMLECRKQAVNKINAMYDLDISVGFNSTWYDNERETEFDLAKLRKEGDENGKPIDSAESENNIS